jgi:hypothetical protein
LQIADNKLQQAGWYHGPMSRQSSELRLKSGGTRQGDFLVRESASVDGFIALSIKGKVRLRLPALPVHPFDSPPPSPGPTWHPCRLWAYFYFFFFFFF